MKFYLSWCIIILLINVIKFSNLSRIPIENGIEQKKTESVEQIHGLYGKNDKILVLDGENLKENTFGKQHATLVEFYNSFCGFCRRYASTWKEFGIDVESWNNVVVIAAIDCAREKNNEICRDFEIMAYPSIRYIPPNYPLENNNIGIDLEKGSNVEELKLMLIKQLKVDENRLETWPDLIQYSEINQIPNITDQTKFVFVVNESEESIVGPSLALDFHSKYFDTIKIFSVLETNATIVSVIILDNHKTIVNEYFVQNGTRESIKEQISQFLVENSIEPNPLTEENHTIKDNLKDVDVIAKDKYDEEFVQQIKNAKALDVIFQSDLNTALKFSIFHEIPGHNKIDGEQLIALQDFLAINLKYFPLDMNGLELIQVLQNYSHTANKPIYGEHFFKMAEQLAEKTSPAFTHSNWIGCYSTIPGLRKYPCSLWTLFHYLTVQSAIRNNTNDNLEVLHAMHGYIKNFFGCTECKNHFVEMADRRNIWNITSKDEAILWLWEAHNEVNLRLAGDTTEDPQFPKIQFPSRESCRKCYRNQESTSAIEWDRDEVLSHLKKIYSNNNLSLLGVENATRLPTTMENLKATPESFRTTLNDMDMKMGIVLYVVCIIIMIVAVKFFLKRGRRRTIIINSSQNSQGNKLLSNNGVSNHI